MVEWSALARRCIVASTAGRGRFFGRRGFAAVVSDECTSRAQLQQRISEADGSVDEYTELLKECGKLGALAEGRQLHAAIASKGLSTNTLLCNHIIHMYGKCGCIEDARQVFSGIPKKNVFSWHSLIVAYAANGYNEEALAGFLEMERAGFHADRLLLLTALNVCGNVKSLYEGRRLHFQVAERKLHTDLVFVNALISLYAKCGCLDDAQSLFEATTERDILTWTSLVLAYFQKGRTRDLFRLLQRMAQEGTKADRVLILTLLNQCALRRLLADAQAVHSYANLCEFHGDPIVATGLVTMYGKCGSIAKARQVFDAMDRRCRICWNAMIATYARESCNREIVSLMKLMKQEGVKPDKITFVSALAGCSTQQEVETIHRYISESGIGAAAVIVGNSLITAYGKCGSLVKAQDVFENMAQRDTISWNTLIAAHAGYGHSVEAHELLQRMEREGVKPVSVTYVSALNACMEPEDLAQGSKLHNAVVKDGLEMNIYVGTAVVHMYGRCGNVQKAQELFEKLGQRDVVLCTGMLSAYAQVGMLKEAFGVFYTMLAEGLKPTNITFASLMNVVCECRSHDYFAPAAELVHSWAKDCGMDTNLVVATTIMSMYAELNELEKARKIYTELQIQDVVFCTAMAGAYVKAELPREALQVYEQMLLQGLKPTIPSFVVVLEACIKLEDLSKGRALHACICESGFQSELNVATALIDMYGKCGCLEGAETAFEEIPVRDYISWTAMIGAYGQQEQGERSLKLFRQMQLEGCRPNNVTLVTALGACSSLAALADGRELHQLAREAGYDSQRAVCNSLVDMYAKCGRLDEAQMIFDAMDRRDAISWNTIIACYRQHGLSSQIVPMVRRMQQDGVRPDAVTFVSLLSALSHAGRMPDAEENFISMTREHGIAHNVKHFNCMVDLLGRLGQLELAEKLISRMTCEPSSAIWMALLGACKSHGDMERGRRAAKRARELDPTEPASHVALFNICAAAGEWDEAVSIRKEMVEKGLKKEPGRSIISIKNRMHEFVAGDRFHPQRKLIYAELHRLDKLLKDQGYVPDTAIVTHNVGELEKEQLLCHHSEKLAVAFGLISTPAGTPLRIIKNLRACSECHTTIKLISGIVGREIVVRDAHRFHHFAKGSCSCGDFW